MRRVKVWFQELLLSLCMTWGGMVGMDTLLLPHMGTLHMGVLRVQYKIHFRVQVVLVCMVEVSMTFGWMVWACALRLYVTLCSQQPQPLLHRSVPRCLLSVARWKMRASYWEHRPCGMHEYRHRGGFRSAMLPFQ